MKVRYTRRAFADRVAIFEYLNQYDPRAARKVKAFIKEKINSLTYSPRRARMVKDLGLRALWLGRYPYIVYYPVDGDVVSIIHIRHAARRLWTDGED